MKTLNTAILFTILMGSALAKLVGYGIWPYKPVCAFACLRALSGYMLTCSSEMEMHGGMHSHGNAMTSPQCRADDTSWLTTLAYCAQTKCAAEPGGVPISELEGFWEAQSTEDPAVPPRWTFSQAAANVTEPPGRELGPDADAETLNFTALVNPEAYASQYNAMFAVQRETAVESSYGIAILVTGFGTPLMLTGLGYVPYISSLLDKIRPYVIYPSLVGTYQVRSLPYLLGNAPTVGQSLYIATFSLLVLILSAVDYKSMQPHAWYPDPRDEVLAYVFYRTGVFAFVMAPLTYLFSSRNNVLLWVTNWSHSTFLLLHRWVARLFALLAMLHTLLALPLYYPAEATQEYWIWGAVATVALVILAVGSGLYVRRFYYEFFLISHIILAMLVLVGGWYHIKLWMPDLAWGYETWLYAAFAVWAFDRLARLARVLRNGTRRSTVTDLGGGYVRIDVAGVRWGAYPGMHVYAFFPTLQPLRPWENHPFSVVPTALLRPRGLAPGSVSEEDDSKVGPGNHDAEKGQGVAARVRATPAPRLGSSSTAAGVTLYVKKSAGMTKYLEAHDGLLTLLDGPYSIKVAASILKCDRLLLIGGGIGITSLIPWTANHSNVKLCWSVKESARCLVDELDGAFDRVVDRTVVVGSRLDVVGLLAHEVECGGRKVGIVVSGPGGLCDDVRAAVIAAGRKQSATVFDLEVDAYTW
ncbi:hypothetical protein KVR01_001715 [Diaporthe batatas]|uniref:uncharacterized protein n=1 Tax=Diaporthe batatas TaxID=748121 RepID=UPI001D0541A8|nr:uncharacterized protein KVR01_001715 [Diaporthe batatas]KAG8168966.1 hypothetical protein KVR01_001715 [Diaporthe batatas]